MVEIKLTLDTGFVGAEHIRYVDMDIPQEEWVKLSHDQKMDRLQEEMDYMVQEYIYVSFEEIK